jgi:alpha,alpha-trehalase
MVRPEQTRVLLDKEDFDAVLFDMDGVVTRTAGLHSVAWKQAFDELLQADSPPPGPAKLFDPEADYWRYVDGKPRYDGVVSFLSSRGIALPYGSPSDPPGIETVCALGNRKESFFQALLQSQGVDVFPPTLELVRSLIAAGIKTGVFSASKNAPQVLAAADLLALFDARVDGLDAERLGLAGKPDPATLLELARRLGASPQRAVVVEDAIAGVQAGRAGGFRLVIGVNRSGDPGVLLEHGADLEVRDLRQVGLATNNNQGV